MTKKIEELKDCPFCGSAGIICKDERGFCYIQCPVCYVKTMHYPGKQKAITAWNTRPKNKQGVKE